MKRLASLCNGLDILLLDGIGALITAISVGLVLPLIQPWIGLPVGVLRALGGLALLLATFSLSRHLLGRGSGAALRVIALANLGYCSLTATLVIYYSDTTTALAYGYFIGEIVIVVVLAARELQLARQDWTRSAPPGQMDPASHNRG